MGENSEIYERLRSLETDLAQIKERMKWLMNLTWLMFGSGGLVGWALATIFGGH